MNLPRAARPRRLALAAALALALSPSLAIANETLLLDLRVNGVSVPGVVMAEVLADGRVLVPATAWQAARLRTPPRAAAASLSDGSAAVALGAGDGFRFVLDRNRLVLDVQAPPDAFAATQTTLAGGARPAPAAGPPGLYLDYDAFVARDGDGDAQAGLLGELVAFGRAGAFVHGFAWRHDGGDDRWLRTDTFFQRDLPGRMQTLVVGDSISSRGGWSRPARFAGIRLARDFSTAPGFVTWPMPTIGGSATLPSTVELLVNERRQATQDVPPGPFELTDVPVANGAGQLQLVVRDVLGRESILSQDYYAAPRLLRAGLADFSHEAGKLRHGYGSDRDRYDEGFVASSYRRGLNDWLTMGGRVEWQSERQAAGLAADARIGHLGVVSLSLSESRMTGARGHRFEVGAQRSSRRGGVSLRWSRAQPGYREFGGIDPGYRVRDEFQFTAGRRLRERLDLGLHLTRRTEWNGSLFRLAGVDLGYSLRGGGYLGLDASRDLDARGWAAGLRLSLPLGRARTVGARAGRRPGGEGHADVEMRQSLPSGPGWGWRVAASDTASQRLQADLLRRGNAGDWSLESRAGDAGLALRLGARGAVGRVSGMNFAARRVDRGAFAIVQVGDFPGVPVSLSHQVVATTRVDGRALVTGLLPYQVNRLGIDAAQLPIEARVESEHAEVVPYARSASLVRYPVRREQAAWMVLRRADGTPVPEGASLRVGPGLSAFTVARRGEAYVTGLADGAVLDVRWRGGACQVRVDGRLLSTAPGVRSAPVVCREDVQ